MVRFKHDVDIYNDENECIGKNLPVFAFHPIYNPYIRKFANFIKRSAFISLETLEQNVKQGRLGEMTTMRKDEVQMPQYKRKWNIVNASAEIAENLKDKLNYDGTGAEDDGIEVREMAGGKILYVRLPQRITDISISNSPLFTIVGVSLGQAISEIFEVNPEDDLDGATLVKSAIFGRYPQTVEFGSNCPIFAFTSSPQAEEGVGTLYRSPQINSIVALANNRTFDAAALATIIEQLGQFEVGNSIGWFEKYHLLGMVYQGFNANNVTLDLIKENAEGTVGDVTRSLMKRSVKDGVVYKPPNKYPFVQPSGYIMYRMKDYSMWNAYSCAGLLAACIVNVGASRAVQGVSAVLGAFGDLIAFESGGLPDPDAGRVMGTGLGFCFYTHSIYGGAGPGAFKMNHVIVRNTSGFLTPCVAAAMCLDAGTQIFSPKMTAKNYFLIRKEFPLIHDPLLKVTEAAKSIKDKF